VVERLSNEPLPPARPVQYGSPRIPDGDTVKGPRPRLPLATREVVYGVILLVLFVVALVVGILR
jgi:hypothetical protein